MTESAWEEHWSLRYRFLVPTPLASRGNWSPKNQETKQWLLPNPRRLKSKFPTGAFPTIPPGDVEGDSMAKKWGISKILLAAAVVVLALAAVGVGIGDLNLIALGLALGFASFIV